MDDTVAGVRDSAADALGTAMKVVGEKAMSPFVEQLDKIKLDKVLLLLSLQVTKNASYKQGQIL